jgi:hypothetical protein
MTAIFFIKMSSCGFLGMIIPENGFRDKGKAGVLPPGSRAYSDGA